MRTAGLIPAERMNTLGSWSMGGTAGRTPRAERERRMNGKLVALVMSIATLFVATAASAASCKKDTDCSTSQVCSAGTCAARKSSAAKAADTVAPTSDSTAGTRRTPYIGWGGLGYYNLGQSADGSNSYFGIHAGGAANLVMLTPDLPLVGWGDLALTFGGDLTLPIAVGAGVRYDKAGPVQLLGGLGFALLPNTASAVGTPVGLRIMGTVLYPVPQLNPRTSAQLQI